MQRAANRLLRLCRREGRLLRGHVLVSLVGFAVDAGLLYTSLGSGLSAPWARAISLFWAMQATFVLNGLYVFRRLRAGDVPRQWLSYMACNGLGNLANYVIFVGLAASRAPVVSNHYVALCIGGFTAWALNYCGARLLAFRALAPRGAGPASARR